MWKFVSRGIRETLERRACRTNVYSQTSQDSNAKSEVKTSLTCNHKFLAPSFSAFNNGFCGSAKTAGTKDKDYNSNTKHTWSEAVGWSSVLAVGWVVCQTLCLRRRCFENEKFDFKSKLPQFPETRISYLFGQVLNLQPKHFLPVTNCIGNTSLKRIQEQNTETDWKADKPFGPITVEEALKEAADEFADVHKIVSGEFELRFGIKALEDKRYKDAINHFTAGATLSSSASMFNLGLCYEMGLGTLVDQVKAAKYYSDAAEHGHADAIYNLGVFHAQGKGGFSVDVGKARSYFIEAAKLGHTQAQHALDLEQRYYESKENNNNVVLSNIQDNTPSYVRNTKHVNNILKKLVGLSSNFDIDSALGSFDRMQTIDTKNSTETFLELLGLKDPNLVPVAVPNDCSVPC